MCVLAGPFLANGKHTNTFTEKANAEAQRRRVIREKSAFICKICEFFRRDNMSAGSTP